MNENYLIVFTGIPGTGKTFLGKELSEFLNVPIVTKDNIKELLADTLGCTDLEFSRKIGWTSYKLLNFISDKFLQFGRPFIIESNFDSIYLKDIMSSLQLKYKFTPIIIHCYADANIVYRRIIERDKSTERHSTHKFGNWGTLEEFNINFLDLVDRLPDINGHIFKVDTTKFDGLNYYEVFNKIKTIING